MRQLWLGTSEVLIRGVPCMRSSSEIPILSILYNQVIDCVLVVFTKLDSFSTRLPCSMWLLPHRLVVVSVHIIQSTGSPHKFTEKSIITNEIVPTITHYSTKSQITKKSDSCVWEFNTTGFTVIYQNRENQGPRRAQFLFFIT